MTEHATSNYQKHQSNNPLQRWLIGRFNARLLSCIRSCGDARTILDVGCGEGFSLKLIQDAGETAHLSGVDYSLDALALGRKQFPDLNLKKGDVYALDFPDHSVDVVICTEVLEHLENPRRALSELVRVSRNYLLVSVPHEPWFMLANFLRGKYVRRWGNHPEHVNHWSRSAFLQMISDAGLVIERVERPFPWTMVLARVPAV